MSRSTQRCSGPILRSHLLHHRLGADQHRPHQVGSSRSCCTSLLPELRNHEDIVLQGACGATEGDRPGRLRARECGVDCSPVRQQPDAFPPQWRWNFALCVTESICHALSSAFLDVATVLAAFGRQLTYSGPVVRVVGAVLVARGLLPQLATAYLIGEKLWGEWYVLRAWPHEWPHSPTAPTPPHPASTRRPPGGWVVPQVQTTLDVSSNATRIAGEPTADITIHRSTKERT